MNSKLIEYSTSTHERLDIVVHRKKVKNVSIRVKSSGRLLLTVPITRSESDAMDFVKRQERWILSKLSKVNNAIENLSKAPLLNMYKIRILGNQKTVLAIESDRNNVVYDGEIIKLYTKDINASEDNLKILQKWYTNYAYKVFEGKINQYYDLLAPVYRITKPSLVVRRMKGVWGNCRPQTAKLTINEYLLMADEECVESVILHEMAHLVVIEHNKHFYDTINRFMPDYKAREKKLNTFYLL